MKNIITKLLLLWVVALMALPASAQQRRISGTVSDDIDVIMGANVKEIDKNNRIVSQAITDMNGNFTMNIKDPNNTLEISFMGYKKWSQKIGSGKSVFKVLLQENTKQLKEVVAEGKKLAPTTGLEVPAREYAGAVQNFKMDDMEGLAFESVDQALQGQIAGLDIVPNSGNLGSGTTMRLRGTTTINGNAQPLIVVNDHIFELPEDAQDVNFETMDNEEQFSTLLNVNPEDIESITVLKDAASTAKWGAKGSNGVIEIKLRRGSRGPTRVNFTYKFKGTWQPEGYEMLNGDGYTMMLKEAYYNPHHQNTSMAELDYNTELRYVYPHYSNNTNWVKEVQQFGQEHKFTVALAGGGDKAAFRISANYDKSTGSIIGQTLNRFTTTTALDYWVSDRIKFMSNINMAFTTNNKNYGNDILARAYNAMPNMSVYEYRLDENGNPVMTDNYFNMLPLAAVYSTGSTARMNNYDKNYYTSYDLNDMFTNGNPVARAMKAWWKQKQYNLTPQFSVEYKLLGKDDDHHRLNYVGDVQLNIYNTSNDQYCPSELKTMDWVWGGDNSASLTSNERNYVSNDEYKSLEFTTRHDLRYYSAFKNRDHSLGALVRFEMATGSSSSQLLGLWNVPNGITDPTVVALLRSASSGTNEWRWQTFYGNVHYSYKSKYNVDASARWDGSTGFGRSHKYGFFPSAGVRWNIIDEDFMNWSKDWLSMLAVRASWGITGGGGAGSNQYNKYATNGYYNGHQVITPENLSLEQLRWEKTRKLNLGWNVGFFKDLVTFEGEVYDHKTTDLLMGNLRIPSANGFSNLAQVNAGVLRNKGWELNFYTSRIFKVGKFSMKFRGNIAQNFNEVEEMNPLILESLNGAETYQPGNLNYNQRVQIGNALGSIYGLHYLGVYKYDYDHNGITNASVAGYGYAEADENGISRQYAQDHGLEWGTGTGYDAHGNPINTAAAAERRGEVHTCPIAFDADGNMLTDAKGIPLPMYYCYNEGYRYQFQGGDAIYEDINHDGQIDRYDMVYLGNSNPKCNGGFGFNIYYGRLSMNVGFNFRVGNQIVNLARMNLESMLNNKNQSFATTWRWRKNGDETVVPRALSSVNGYKSYNSLPSDRYVENGDYLRLQYVQLNYEFDAKKLKKYHINQLKLHASLDNLWCWTKYTGVDPDVSPQGFAVSRDNNRTPRTKSFTCSLTLGF